MNRNETLLMQPTPILMLLFIMTCWIVGAQKKTHVMSRLVERVEPQSQGCGSTSGERELSKVFKQGPADGTLQHMIPHVRINMKSPWVYADYCSVR